MGSHIVYKIILTLKIIYWPIYLNEYIKIPVFKNIYKSISVCLC